MAEKDTDGSPLHSGEALPDVERFVEGLTQEERMLVILKQELYDGSWDAMLTDLRSRLEGKPYIFKLAHRIQDDMKRIEKLQAFEQQHDISLNQYLTPTPK